MEYSSGNKATLLPKQDATQISLVNKETSKVDLDGGSRQRKEKANLSELKYYEEIKILVSKIKTIVNGAKAITQSNSGVLDQITVNEFNYIKKILILLNREEEIKNLASLNPILKLDYDYSSAVKYLSKLIDSISESGVEQQGLARTLNNYMQNEIPDKAINSSLYEGTAGQQLGEKIAGFVSSFSAMIAELEALYTLTEFAQKGSLVHSDIKVFDPTTAIKDSKEIISSTIYTEDNICDFIKILISGKFDEISASEKTIAENSARLKITKESDKQTIDGLTKKNLELSKDKIPKLLKIIEIYEKDLDLIIKGDDKKPALVKRYLAQANESKKNSTKTTPKTIPVKYGVEKDTDVLFIDQDLNLSLVEVAGDFNTLYNKLTSSGRSDINMSQKTTYSALKNTKNKLGFDNFVYKDFDYNGVVFSYYVPTTTLKEEVTLDKLLKVIGKLIAVECSLFIGSKKLDKNMLSNFKALLIKIYGRREGEKANDHTEDRKKVEDWLKVISD